MLIYNILNLLKCFSIKINYILIIYFTDCLNRNMSLYHSQNNNTVKKIKLDEVDEDGSIIAECKICAVLKYCDENEITTNHLDKLFISNDFLLLGLYCFVFF